MNRSIASSLRAGGAMRTCAWLAPALVRRNGWGEFVFRGYRLSGAHGAAERIGAG